MLFSEGDQPWRPVPLWADFLLKCGFWWCDQTVSARRIGLISMPCDSAGASLVALGALRRRLSNAEATELGSHFQRIHRLSAQGAPNILLRNAKYRGRFVLGRRTSEIVWANKESLAVGEADHSGPPRLAILASNANEWSFDGEPPVQLVEGAETSYGAIYDALLPSAEPIQPANLRCSDSGLCIAGRVAGEGPSRAIAANIRVQQDECIVGLDQLLTIHAWSPNTISRTAFFNSRLGQFDRRVAAPRLVVADGEAAFLRVLDAQEFKHSDVLGVVQRTIERDRLEAIGVKMSGQRQWYTEDVSMDHLLRSKPPRVSVLCLRQR